MSTYREFFAFTKEPFAQDVDTKDLFPFKSLEPCIERFKFVLETGAVCVITGEIGAGKSTTLRLCASKLHPAKHKTIALVALNGSWNELLRQIILSFGAECRTNSLAVLTKTARGLLLEVIQKKQIPVLLVDEAQLLRQEVFAQIHTLTQFEYDSRSIMPMMLSGQNQLLDKLSLYTARPLASRIVAKTHLESLSLLEMTAYLEHHLKVAGLRENPFVDNTVQAIHQGSGGFLRKANSLARGALIAAAREKSQMVTAEHVRLAATELM